MVSVGLQKVDALFRDIRGKAVSALGRPSELRRSEEAVVFPVSLETSPVLLLLSVVTPLHSRAPLTGRREMAPICAVQSACTSCMWLLNI